MCKYFICYVNLEKNDYRTTVVKEKGLRWFCQSSLKEKDDKKNKSLASLNNVKVHDTCNTNETMIADHIRRLEASISQVQTNTSKGNNFNLKIIVYTVREVKFEFVCK